MPKSKRKKIFYVPGIISLIILPMVFICFAKTQIKEKDIRVISLFWADTNFMNARSSLFLKLKHTDITFTGNDKDDNIKLAFAQIRIKEILTKNDTTSGLNFIFNDSSTYGTFVKTIDILQSIGAEYYVPYGNNIWFYHIKPLPVEKIYPCLLCNDIVFLKPQIPKWKILKQKTIKSLNSSWGMILLYSVFIISTCVFKYRKSNQK